MSNTHESTTVTMVKDLLVGAMVDLEFDDFADPDGENPLWEFEYLEVVSVEVESPECVVVTFHDDAVVGFPPEHGLTQVVFAAPTECEQCPNIGETVPASQNVQDLELCSQCAHLCTECTGNVPKSSPIAAQCAECDAHDDYIAQLDDDADYIAFHNL